MDRLPAAPLVGRGSYLELFTPVFCFVSTLATGEGSALQLYIIPTEDEDGGDVEMECVIEQASVMISANNLGHGVNKATAA